MRWIKALLPAGLGIHAVSGTPMNKEEATYVDWNNFKAYGVNLGGWLVQESTIDTAWWNKYSGGASDEWGLCKHLGSQCGPVLEERYATWITTDDIDNAARSGVNLLRIPTTYAAWIKYPRSELYSGKQTSYLKEIALYAIERHGMHIIVDIHSLPGGINGLTIGEAAGHWGWFQNQTNLNYSMRVIDAVVSFIQSSGHPASFTLEPLNEAVDNKDLSVFGTSAALSHSGATWIVRYIRAVLEHVAAVNYRIPVMFQDCFQGEEYWSANFSQDQNLVFDTHNYYFDGRNTTAANAASYMCADAKKTPSDRKFPTFVGEWSIQALYNNSYALRERNFNTGLSAFHQYSHGSAYWTWKFFGNASVNGQGTQADYWNYQSFVNRGWFHPNSSDIFPCS